MNPQTPPGPSYGNGSREKRPILRVGQGLAHTPGN